MLKVSIGPDVLIIFVYSGSFVPLLKFLEGRIVFEEVFCTYNYSESVFLIINVASHILIRDPIIVR